MLFWLTHEANLMLNMLTNQNCSCNIVTNEQSFSVYNKFRAKFLCLFILPSYEGF